ncbi:MAG: elongation factor P [Mycoplasma sp.]
MATMIDAKDLRSGNAFYYKGNLYQVIENSFNKTAMREGIVKCKVKNLRTGSITVEVLTGEKLEQALLSNIKMNFQYVDGENYVFVDTESWEQIEIPAKQLEWEKNFITEDSEVNVLKNEEEILGISLADQVILTIKEAEEAIQGNSVQSAQKKAWLVTGWEIQVPQFIKTGEKVLIETKTGKYISRA